MPTTRKSSAPPLGMIFERTTFMAREKLGSSLRARLLKIERETGPVAATPGASIRSGHHFNTLSI
jgi:hypothetical protein